MHGSVDLLVARLEEQKKEFLFGGFIYLLTGGLLLKQLTWKRHDTYNGTDKDVIGSNHDSNTEMNSQSVALSVVPLRQ